jgi:CubicO group peptidase (beta-lactamase class C family)
MKRALACALVLAAVVQAQQATNHAEVDRIFAAFNTHTPGCSVGVAQNGRPVFESGYGMADLERNVAITPETIFESGSVAKQFTAATILLLAQQGKLSVDDPMRKYLPELADYGAPLTIRQVLSHISGLREWRPVATFGGRPEDSYVYTNQDILELAAKQHTLNFDSGTAYSYSNTGFNLFPILIERVVGKSFQSFTHDMIFAPLGMEHTRWRDNFHAIVPHRALSYSRVDGNKGEWEQDTPIENIIGAGGLLTTVGDLLLWNENFTHGRVGGPALVKTQQTPATLSGGRTIAYAAGLTINTVHGLREVSHSGSTGGYRTWLGRYPDQAVSVAVLCNSAQANPTALGRETARLWTGAAPAKVDNPSYAVDAAKLEALAGLYRKLRDNTVTHIEWRDGKLHMGAASLLPSGPDKFLLGDTGDIQAQFGEGPPVHMRIITPNGDVVYERVEQVQPSSADLAGLAGEYESHETGTTLKIASGQKPGEITYRIGMQPPVTLKPTFRDGFETSAGASIYFRRDAGGKVTALSVGDDRVWDLRFERIH